MLKESEPEVNNHQGKIVLEWTLFICAYVHSIISYIFSYEIKIIKSEALLGKIYLNMNHKFIPDDLDALVMYLTHYL